MLTERQKKKKQETISFKDTGKIKTKVHGILYRKIRDYSPVSQHLSYQNSRMGLLKCWGWGGTGAHVEFVTRKKCPSRVNCSA